MFQNIGKIIISIDRYKILLTHIFLVTKLLQNDRYSIGLQRGRKVGIDIMFC